jgi:hypothetical protein
MLCVSYYCLYFLFNKTGDKGRTDSAWKWGAGREGGEMAQTMYAHMNKWKKLKCN